MDGERFSGSLGSYTDAPSAAAVTVIDSAIGARAGGTEKPAMAREGRSIRRRRDEKGPAAAASARARWGEAGDRIRDGVDGDPYHAATRRGRKEDIVERWSTEGMHAYMRTWRMEEACWWQW